MGIKFIAHGQKVNKCPVRFCWRKPIHAEASDHPGLDPDGDFGFHLKVECPKHGWQDRGFGWNAKELREAGLT